METVQDVANLLQLVDEAGRLHGHRVVLEAVGLDVVGGGLETLALEVWHGKLDGDGVVGCQSVRHLFPDRDGCGCAGSTAASRRISAVQAALREFLKPRPFPL